MPKNKSKVQRKKLIETNFDDSWGSESSYQFLKLPTKKTADIENHDDKSRVQRKKLIETNFDDSWGSESSYQFLKSPTKKTADIENHDFSQPIEEMQQDDFLVHNDTPMTANSVISMLSDVSNEIVVGRSGKRKRVSNNYMCKKIKITDTVIEETPASSLASGAKTFYCSQTLYETVNISNPDIMQYIVPSVALAKGASHSQPKISQCSTSVATNDDDKTLSGLDLSATAKNNYGQSDIIINFISQKQDVFATGNVLEDLDHDDNAMQNQGYVMSQLYNSQEQESSQHNTLPRVSNPEYVMTQLYDSNSFGLQNQQSLLNTPHQNTAANSNIINNFYTPQHCANGGFLLRNIDDQKKSSQSDESDHCSVSPSNGKDLNMAVDQGSPVQSNTNGARDIEENESFDTVVPTHYSDDMFAEDNTQLAEKSWQRKAFHKKNNLSCMNCSPACDAYFPSTNNPPIEYLMCKGSNRVNQKGERLNKDHRSVSGFNENTECENVRLFESQNFNDSFPLTPVDTTVDSLNLPPTLLLSNYCNEHDKAYTMRDLKPNQYRNYRHDESMRSLKEHLDSLIPPNVSIRDFYNMKNLP